MGKNRRYELKELKNILQYGLIAQGKGSILWWFFQDDANAGLKTHVSNGTQADFHICVVKGAKIDCIWRGRADKDKGGTVTVLPPLHLYGNFMMNDNLADELVSRFNPERILVDTESGMKQLIIKD